MANLQELYDDAMFEVTQGNCDSAIGKLEAILREDPDHFDAQLALGGVYYAKGDFARAVEEGHKAEKMRPNEQLVHTNLSRAYMRLGDKKTAEHHGLQARIAGWRGNMAAPAPGQKEEPDLKMAQPPKPPVPSQIPDMPWKKKPGSSGPS